MLQGTFILGNLDTQNSYSDIQQIPKAAPHEGARTVLDRGLEERALAFCSLIMNFSHIIPETLSADNGYLLI